MSNPVDRFTQNQLLGRGVNIAGYDPIWRSRSDARMQARHFRLIREAGFNHVRINLHPFQFMGAAPFYEIRSAWLDTLDWMVEQSQKNGLLSILDMHEFTAMADDPVGLKPKFFAVWKQLSTRYQSAGENILFEILNEPNDKITPELWNEYLKEPLSIIRATNPTRTLIIGPAFWNGIDFLHKLELPKDDPHIIVTVHYYHPMDFTHQGAHWSPEHREKSGIWWQGSEGELKRLRRDFDGVNTWAEEHNLPVYLGEFGAYDKADMHSRARYTNAVSREAERLSWSWGYWQFDSDFVVYDIDQDRWVEPILNALIPKYSQSQSKINYHRK
jgi:endoglucanase